MSPTDSPDAFRTQLVDDGAAILERALDAVSVRAFERSILDLLEHGLHTVCGQSVELDSDDSGAVDYAFACAGEGAPELSRWLYQHLYASDAAHDLLHSLRPTALFVRRFGGTEADCFERRESTVVRVDLPGRSPIRLGWHQEGRYDPTRSNSIQFWTPLFRRSSPESGSVEFAVGSHRLGLLEVALANPGGEGAQQYLVDDEIVARYPCRIVTIDPCDVLVLDHRTIHRSSDPDRQRYAKVTLVGRCLSTIDGER